MKRPFCVLMMIVAFTGCAVEQEYSRTPRTAVEQLLLTQVLFYLTWAATDLLAPP